MQMQDFIPLSLDFFLLELPKMLHGQKLRMCYTDPMTQKNTLIFSQIGFSNKTLNLVIVRNE